MYGLQGFMGMMPQQGQPSTFGQPVAQQAAQQPMAMQAGQESMVAQMAQSPAAAQAAESSIVGSMAKDPWFLLAQIIGEDMGMSLGVAQAAKANPVLGKLL